MEIIPGKQYTAAEKHTTTKDNLLAIPQIALEADDVENIHIAGPIDGDKISNLPMSSLDADVQSNFGFKNWATNPAFDVWGTGTSISTANIEGPTQWFNTIPAAFTLTRQTITPGESDTLLAGSRYYARLQTTGTSGSSGGLFCRIPNVRNLSGKKVTISAVLRNISGTLPAISFRVAQNFGTGGSPSTSVNTDSSALTVTNGWTKVSATLNIPSVASKTIGTNGDDRLAATILLANFSSMFFLDIANFQIQVGDTSTEFEDVINKRWQVSDFVDSSLAPGRLTLSSGVPVMTSEVAGATTIYYCPYVGKNLALFNGFFWDIYQIQELSLSLAGLAANTPHDIFASAVAGIPTLTALAWSNTTTRATALTVQDGVKVLSGDTSKRWLGTVCTNGSTGQTDFIPAGSAAAGRVAKVLIDNADNKVDVAITSSDTTASWTYNSTTWRAANNSALNAIQVLQALTEEPINIRAVAAGGGFGPMVGIGTSTSTVLATPGAMSMGSDSGIITQNAIINNNTLGSTTYYINERNRAAGGTTTFYGNNTPYSQGLVVYKKY